MNSFLKINYKKDPDEQSLYSSANYKQQDKYSSVNTEDKTEDTSANPLKRMKIKALILSIKF